MAPCQRNDDRMTKRPLVVMVIASLIITTFFVASAQLTPRRAAAQTGGSIELVAQSSWVDDGGIFNIQVRVAGASQDSSVQLRVFSPWTDRDNFLRRVLDEEQVPLLDLEPVLLRNAQDTSNEVLGLEFLVDGPNTRLQTELDAATGDDAATPSEDAATPSDAEEGNTDDPSPDEGAVAEPAPAPVPVPIPVPEPLPALISEGGSAVYPIEVSLLDVDGNVTDQFLTSMIEIPRRSLEPPLDVAIVLEANIASVMSPDADVENTLDQEALTRLGVLADTIEQHPNAELALSISPETLLTLARDPSDVSQRILDQFRDHLSPEQLLPNPVTELEEQAWFDADLTDELVQLYEAGSSVALATIGVEPDSSVVLLDPTLNGSGLDELDELGVQGAIIRPAQLTPLNRSIFPQALTTSFLTEGEDERIEPVPSLATDGALANHFTQPGGAVLNANRVLADLVLLSLQNTGRQSVVINPATSWEPDAAFLNVLLGGLERVPAIRGASPNQALAQAEITPSLGIGTVSVPLVRQLNPVIQPQDLRSFRTEFSQARNAIDSWSTVIGDDTASRQQLDELLYLSTNTGRSNGERTEFIESIYTLIDTQKDASITTPERETITLTGRDSVVPIIVENNLDTNAEVLMLLSSDELDFPESSELFASLAPGTNLIEIPITARASGDSPIQIQVLSPDGLILLGSAEVLVRTFAFSGVGIAIGAVAIIVLLAWWLRHVRGARATVTPLAEEQAIETDEVIGV